MTQSNEPTIDQINETIARFMGFEKVTVGYSGCDDETEWQVANEQWMDKVGIEMVGNYIVNVKEDKWHDWDEVKYHTSWDWLMPIGKKISDLLKDNPDKQGNIIEYDIQWAISEYDIVKSHFFIHKFITWLNQQTTTNE